MAAKVDQERANVRRGADQDYEEGIVRQDRNDRQPTPELQNAGTEVSPAACGAQLGDGPDHAREEGGHALRVDTVDHVGVDGQAISSHHEDSVYPRAFSKRLDHITDGCHWERQRRTGQGRSQAATVG